MSKLGLEDLLPAEWRDAELGRVIRAQPDAVRYLGPGRAANIIPAREVTFRALLDHTPVERCKVIVVGQDPYPRAQSAVGIAFNDGAIAHWTDRTSPSFANIAKAAMAHAGCMAPGGNIKDLRAAVKRAGVVDPPQWFEALQAQGVMWLNRALTFSSTDTAVLREHTAFWRPIVDAIFETIIAAKRGAAAEHRGLVVIMWGEYAQQMQAVVERLNAEDPIPVEFVCNAHPAATGPALARFHANNSFTAAADALERLGMEPIDWAPTSSPASAGAGAGAGAAAGASAADDAADEEEQPRKRKKAKK